MSRGSKNIFYFAPFHVGFIFLVTLALVHPSFSFPVNSNSSSQFAEDDDRLPTEEELNKFFLNLMSRPNLEKYYGVDTVANFPVYPIDDGEEDLESNSFLGSGVSDPGQDDPDRAKVTFYLYTDPKNPNNRTKLELGNTTILESSGFDPTAPTKIITHGYYSNHEKGPGLPLKNAYMTRALDSCEKINIISVDWWDLAGPAKPSTQEHGASEFFYFPAARNTKLVGTQIARLIDFLIKNRAPIDSFHLIGHSLGAHVMGWAARSITDFNTSVDIWTRRRKRIPRVTALDPASPCFERRTVLCLSSVYTRVHKDDTDFLDVIHTHGRYLGYSEVIGHADFYPNYGNSQPGCKWTDFDFGACSHARAIDYMIESILAPPGQPAFHAAQCDDWDDFYSGECKSRATNGGHGVKKIPMGEHCPTHASGIFYLETNSKSPFRIEATSTSSENKERKNCEDVKNSHKKNEKKKQVEKESKNVGNSHQTKNKETEVEVEMETDSQHVGLLVIIFSVLGAVFVLCGLILATYQWKRRRADTDPKEIHLTVPLNTDPDKKATEEEDV